MKKRFISLITALAMTAAFIVLPSAEAINTVFSDVSTGDWYYEYVQYAYENGLMNGVGGGEFDPEGTLSRAMFVTVLGRLAGVEESDYSGNTGFEDVAAGQWYSAYVKWAAKNDITSGYGDNTFGLDDNVTREQMAVFIYRYVENSGLYLPNSSQAAEQFNDADTVSDWAVNEVDRVRAWGIFTGDEDGKFTPANNTNRAEASAVFMRLDEYLFLSSPEADSLADIDESHIAADEDTGIEYIDNTVLVFTKNYLTDTEKQSVADMIDGEIIGQLSGALDMLQIQVQTSTLEELKAMIDILESNELVYSAAYDMMMQIDTDADSSNSSSW